MRLLTLLLCFLPVVAEAGGFSPTSRLTTGFSRLSSRTAQMNARLQLARAQNQARLARQAQFLQQQQLVAANTVNVHAQLAQLRALQQAQALEAIHLSQVLDATPVLLDSSYAAPVVKQQAVVKQPVVKSRVIHCAPQRCVPQRVFYSGSCR